MAKYLITGGCGFIGSHLADALLESGENVRILDDLSTGKREHAPKAAELIIGSITNKEDLKVALKEVEGVFHLAAVPSVQKSFEHWSDVHAVNSGGTVLLFEAIAQLKKKIPVIFASSSAVYGNRETICYENDPKHPLSPYGIEKLEGEWQANILSNTFDVPTTCFRFFNVFGPRQDPSSPYSGVISIFSKRLANREPLTIYGDGEQLRDFVYVKDVVDIMRAALFKRKLGHDIFNICSGIGTSINRLADIMERQVDTKVERIYHPPRKGDIQQSIGSPQKLHTLLQLKTAYSLEEQLCV